MAHDDPPPLYLSQTLPRLSASSSESVDSKPAAASKNEKKPPWSGISSDELLDDGYVSAVEGEVIDLPPGSLPDEDDLSAHARAARNAAEKSTKRRRGRPSRSLMDELAKEHRNVITTAGSNSDVVSRSPRHRAVQEKFPLLSVSVPESQPGSTATAALPSPFLDSPLLSPLDHPPSPAVTFANLSTSVSSLNGRPVSPRSKSFNDPCARRSSRRRMTRSSSSSSAANAFLSQWTTSKPTAIAPPAPGEQGSEFSDGRGTTYVVGQQIGFGAFSTVNEAWTLELSETRTVRAVKIIQNPTARKPSPGDNDDPDQLQHHLQQEIKIWRSLHHANIIPLLATSSTSLATYCLMPRAATSLRHIIHAQRAQRGLSLPLARRYIRDLASALRFLHREIRLVHRDVKMDNCLIQYDTPADENPRPDDDQQQPPATARPGRLMLSDFGLADYISPQRRCRPTTPTQPGVTVLAGSLPYAAPELLEEDAADVAFHPAVDNWALGVTSFAILTGKLPFWHSFEGILVKEIRNGAWNIDLVRAIIKAKAPAEVAMFDAVHALDLLHGTLDLHAGTRWGAAQVLSCQFLSQV